MKRPITILALGDSLTEGFGIPAEHAFPVLLEHRLRKRGHPASVLNLGLSGDTTAGGLQRLQRFFNLQRSPLTFPHAAIVELGANDGLQGISPEEVEGNLRAILQLLKKHNIPVLLAGMKLLTSDEHLFADEEYAAEFSAIFPRLAQAFTSFYYPFFLEGVFGVPSLLLCDGLHPNSEGTRLVAEKILPLVEQLIQKEVY